MHKEDIHKSSPGALFLISLYLSNCLFSYMHTIAIVNYRSIKVVAPLLPFY